MKMQGETIVGESHGLNVRVQAREESFSDFEMDRKTVSSGSIIIVLSLFYSKLTKTVACRMHFLA